MEQFIQRLRNHARHIEEVAQHCDSEETTKQALILPLLDILGYSPYDPTKVKAEFQADVPGIKRAERVDYALFSEGKPVMFIEAKSCKEVLTNHASQLARYFNATPSVCVAAISNGLEWYFFTDLQHENIMDDEPFLIVDFAILSDSHIQELARFRHGVINTEGLKAIAKDLTYLAKYKQVVQACLKDIEPEFVRFVAGKATPNLRLTQSTLESLAPLVKRAVTETMVDMVAGSLNVTAQPVESAMPIAVSEIVEPDARVQEAGKIVTTDEERRLFGAVRRLLKGLVTDGDLIAKDTESYFVLLYQGKANRWLLRYNVNRRQPTVQFLMPLSDDHKREITRAGLTISTGDAIGLTNPEDILRISGLVYDALSYCQDNEHFRLKRNEKEPSNANLF